MVINSYLLSLSPPPVLRRLSLSLPPPQSATDSYLLNTQTPMLGTWMTIIAVGGQQLLTSGNSASASKKNTSRRNAWGNLSYADLITQAITSANETRLTLSQIYEWMVQNVPYFKDKGDSNSSAGWKVRVWILIYLV